MSGLRKLLLPFSLLYGAVVWVRNHLYNKGLLESVRFPVPVIAVGNLTTGGTGKTPHVEYLIRLLRKEFLVATLSRGYGRKTKGFILLSNPSSTQETGDEPMQYYTKFPDILVSVGEDRRDAIDKLLHRPKRPQVILMDDAFQHRRVTPSCNILLIEYDSFFHTDHLLPAGNLREGRSGRSRADIIIISKSPSILVPIERKRILELLQPEPHQQVYFSFLKYGEFNRLNAPVGNMLMGASYYMEKRFTILMVTGIANPSGLIEYLRRHTDKLETLVFPDHHEFTDKDIRRIQERFDNIANPSKIIVTTEKDAMRLRDPQLNSQVKNLPFFYLPVEVAIHQEGEKLNSFLTEHVRKNQTNN